MASWWTAAGASDGLDLEENSIMSRVIQAVGLFGDILSLEDTMESMLSEVQRQEEADDTEGAATGEEEEGVQKVEEEEEMEEEKEEPIDDEEEKREEKEERMEDRVEKEVDKEEDQQQVGGKEEKEVTKEEQINDEEEKMEEREGKEEEKEEQVREEGGEQQVEDRRDKNESKEGKEEEEEEEEELQRREKEEEVKKEKEVENEEQQVDDEEEEEMEEREEKEVENEEQQVDEEEEEEEMEALVAGEERAEEEEKEWKPFAEPVDQLDQPDSPTWSPSSPAEQASETLSHDGAGTGSEAPSSVTDEERGSGAAKDLSGDISPTSPSSDKEVEGASTHSASVAGSDPPPVQARPDLRDPTEVEHTSLTSFPGPAHRGETSAAEDITRDITPGLQTDPQASGCRSEEKVTLMDEAAQSSLRAGPGGGEPGPTQNSPSAGNPAMEVKEDKGDKEEGGQKCHKMNGESDDKKNDGRQSSKYKSVSYRKIRRGNTRQRIDEFESMMNL